MGSKIQILPADLGILSLHLFFLSLPLEQALLVPTIKKPLVSLAKLEAVVSITIVLLCCSTLELVIPALFALSIFLFLTYFPFSSYLKQLLCRTIV